MAKCGFFRPSLFQENLLTEILAIEGLARAYSLLADQPSKDLFIKLLAYRILGPQHVRLPLNNPEYWSMRRSARRCIEKHNVVQGVPILGSLDLCNIDGISLVGRHLAILNTFLLEQYRCRRAGIGIEPGDVVIDGGGCWGDTALYFAQTADKVFCFECMPSNIEILKENLIRNEKGQGAALARKIHLVPRALWNRSHERIEFEDRGPGSLPAASGPTIAVETCSIDDFVSENSLEKLDFIKMDIEGSEPKALVGAERTIRKCRPKLAISIYHDLRHFASIPNWIDSLNLGYRFYVDHFTIHAEETVLFASSEPASS
jgi:FkbM family methyltransferase